MPCEHRTALTLSIKAHTAPTSDVNRRTRNQRTTARGVYRAPIHMDVFALAQCDISTVGRWKVREHRPARPPSPRYPHRTHDWSDTSVM